MSTARDNGAFVPGCKYDVFVSYAHVSNQRALEDTPGWVTKLVELLKQNLAESLGRKDAFKLWMDKGGMAGHKQLTSEIHSTLRETATLLIIMSPGYLASGWCQQELAAFLEAVQDRLRNDSRIFLVHREPVDKDAMPHQLRDLIGYSFWVEDELGIPSTLGVPTPTKDDRAYWQKHNWLSHELSTELKEIAKVSAESSPPDESTQIADDRPAVFLAKETNEDLRREVADYFEQAGLRVVPAVNQAYSYEESEFRSSVKEDLAACSVFVQLLSELDGRIPPGSSRRYIAMQHELAIASRKPILLWRSRKLDLAKITDADYLSLLQDENVLAVGIEEFKRTAVERAREEFARIAIARERSESQTAGSSEHSAYVRISAEKNDEPLKKKISEAFDKHDVLYDAEEFPSLEKELEYVFKNCDGLIIAYGQATKAQVVARLRECKTQMFRPNRKPLLLALYPGPPPETPKVGMRLPRMRTIDGRDEVNENGLLDFIGDIETETARAAGDNV